MDIASNLCTANNVIIASSRAEKDLSSADHYSQVDVVALFGGSYIGGAVRFAGAAQTYYQGVMYSGDSKFYVSKLVAGAETHLGTAVSVTTNFPEAYKCLISGSTLKGYQAGVERRSETDTAITSGTRTGISAYGSGYLDNFSAADSGTTTKVLALLRDCRLTDTPGVIEYAIEWTLLVRGEVNGTATLLQDTSTATDADITSALRTQLAAYVSTATGQSFVAADVRGLSFG